jgi:hypothetical protein
MTGPRGSRTRRLAAGLLAAALAPAAAEAQDEFTPRNIRVGSFLLQPEITLAETWNDNIFYTENDEESDFITNVRPSLRLRSTWSRHALNAYAYYDADFYADHSEENDDAWGAAVDGFYDIQEGARFSGFGAYDHYEEDRFDAETGDDRDDVDRLTGQLRLFYTFNRLGVTLTGRAVDYSYDDQEDRDRLEYLLGVRGAWLFSPRFNIFAEPFYTNRDFNDDTNPRDSDTVGFNVGAAFDVTGLITGEAGIGYAKASFDDPDEDDFDYLTLTGSLDWAITQLTTITGGLSRADEETTQDGASAKVVTAATVGVEHYLRRNIILNADFTYENEDFEGIERVDNNYILGFGGRYLVNRNIELFAGYLLRDRESDADGEDFLSNAITVGITGRL